MVKKLHLTQWHGLDHCIYKKTENTVTDIKGKADSRVLINNREKDQFKIIYIHSGDANNWTSYAARQKMMSIWSESSA